jgi:hypothetical protein
MCIDIQYSKATLSYQEALLMSDEPHPIERLMQGLYLCASFTTPGVSYQVDLRGVTPVCTCKSFRPHRPCKHIAPVAAQAPAIEEALHAERRAARIAQYGSEQAAANAVGALVWGPDYTTLPEPVAA